MLWRCQPQHRLTLYWSVIAPDKSKAQIEAEKWILVVPYAPGKYCLPLCTLTFQRWMLFVASFVAQFCNGSLYAWSILNPHIDSFIQGRSMDAVPTQNKTGLSSALPPDEKAVVAFYIAAGVLGFAAALSGPFIERHGPRHSLIVALCLLFVGYLAAFFSIHYKSYVGLYIGYGVFCGAGYGIGYIAPVSALIKWYPDLRGTAGGFGVCGFGLGAAIWGDMYEPLIAAVGIDWFFLVFGAILSLILLISAFVLRTPPPNYVVGGRNVHGVKVSVPREDSICEKPEGNSERTERVSVVLEDERKDHYFNVFDYQEQELGEAEILYHNKIKNLRIRECVVSVDFAFLYVVFFGAVATGIVLMSRVFTIGKEIFLQEDDHTMTLLVMYLSICNFLGRTLCPLLSDAFIRFAQLNPAFGRKFVIGLLLVDQVVVLALLKSLIHDPNSFGLFQVVLFFLTFSYGGVLGMIPSLLTDMYGVYNSGTMHGIILTAWSIGAIGGGLTFQHYFFKIKDSYPMEQMRDGEIAAYIFNFHWLLVIACIALALVPLVRTNPVDRFYPGYQFSIFGRPLIRFTKKDY
ncbi:unnamed protein product [Aphanomyces euteiches]|uniref:Major facilitator superfamily (MFS) profile domain-containing protein n=1 Tax=Aphanomyces euteiches TaxID=100861 RepID=A0A6G0X9M3_9STRA|nr:hypothetical protein Ae201684_006946 [Aphanomyces euteiches]KAH9086636.1 hypothetical protein Ae201684P_000058 [Aphanomyces euteiches]KAH9154730.1 hypothetical protein AeRB84_003212 [Aphanomyces euteiches]